MTKMIKIIIVMTMMIVKMIMTIMIYDFNVLEL